MTAWCWSNLWTKVRLERMGHIELKAPVSHTFGISKESQADGLHSLIWSPTCRRSHLFCGLWWLILKDTPLEHVSYHDWAWVPWAPPWVSVQAHFVVRWGQKRFKTLLKQVDLKQKLRLSKKNWKQLLGKTDQGCSSFGCSDAFYSLAITRAGWFYYPTGYSTRSASNGPVGCCSPGLSGPWTTSTAALSTGTTVFLVCWTQCPGIIVQNEKRMLPRSGGCFDWQWSSWSSNHRTR